jgi:hypothetical protein
MMTRFKRLESALLTLGTLALAMPAAQARFVFVDFGDPVSFATDGQLFTQPLSTGGTVPFQLNFGQGTNTYDYCYSGTGGFVQFVGSGNPCAAGPVPAPGSNYIAPFQVDLLSNNPTVTGGFIDDIDSGSGSDPYELANATTPAIRFIWSGEEAAHLSVIFELMLIDRGSGNFDVDFMYGSELFGIDGAPDTGQQVIALGSNILGPTLGPFSSNVDYSWSFVDGACTNCGGGTPVTVPEPPLSLMWACALAAVVFAYRRRFAAGSRASGSSEECASA